MSNLPSKIFELITNTLWKSNKSEQCQQKEELTETLALGGAAKHGIAVNSLLHNMLTKAK